MSRTRSTACCAVIAAAAMSAGCAAVVTTAAERMAADLRTAVLDHDDPETVRAGAPAWMLMADSMVAASPGNAALHGQAALLYASYAGTLIEDEARAARLARRARDYARRALCLRRDAGCGMFTRPFAEFESALGRYGARDVELLHASGISELVYIRTHRGEWHAHADLPRTQALLERVIALAPGHADGEAQAYLAVIHSLRPPALGGEPQTARALFEEAIERSGGANLMSKVLYAEYHARAVMDRALHDRLLEEVLAADHERPGHTLSNVLARQRAAELLEEAGDHFIDL